MYEELVRRAIAHPVARPNWDQYLDHGLRLTPSDKLTLYLIVNEWLRCHPAERHDVIQITTVKVKDVATLNIDRMSPELQQVVLTFLNQTVPVAS